MDAYQLGTVGVINPAPVIVLTILALLAAVWTWFTLDPRFAWRARAGIIALRVGALFLALVLFVQPGLTKLQTEHRPARVALLVDMSGSMTSPTTDRLATVRSLLAPHLHQLKAGSRGLTFEVYAFDETLRKMADPGQMATPDEPTAGTDIVGVLNQLAQANADTPLAGAIVLSDGADRSGGGAPAALEFNAPVNTVLIRGNTRARDLRIETIKADPFAFSRQVTPVEVTVENRGIDLDSVNVRILHDGAMVAQKQISLLGGRGQAGFELIPRKEELGVYSVVLPVPDGDELPRNNVQHFSFEVIRDRYRILHLSGGPSFDQRFLRDALTSWPQVDLVSFYALRTPSQSAGGSSAGLSLIPFPTEELFGEHLREFDVVIFQDFAPDEVGVDPWLDEIAAFVKEGGALVLIGGQRGFTSRSVAISPLAALLPVALIAPGTPEHLLYTETPFTPVLTPAGRLHPLTRAFHAEDPAPSVLRALPRLPGMMVPPRLTPMGTALLQHPSLAAEDGPATLVAAAEADRGRVLAVATDMLWSWRFGGALQGSPANVYPDFWKQAIRWLTRDPRFDPLRIQLTPPRVEQGARLLIDIDAADEKMQPLSGAFLTAELTWTTADGVEQVSSERIRTDDRGTYRMEWRPAFEGPHRIVVRTEDGKRQAAHPFLVHPASGESNRMGTDEAFLQQLARRTGGNHFDQRLSLRDIATRATPATRIRSRSTVLLWAHPVALLLLAALLGAEWFLRRRHGLP